MRPGYVPESVICYHHYHGSISGVCLSAWRTLSCGVVAATAGRKVLVCLAARSNTDLVEDSYDTESVERVQQICSRDPAF